MSGSDLQNESLSLIATETGSGDGKDPEYSSSEHWLTLRDNVERSRLEGGFADLIICVGRRRFPCHRVILAAGAPYFRSMFSSGMEECRKKAIEIKEIDPEVFEHTLRYIYTGQINISVPIAPELFTQAHMFQIASLVELCFQFFRENISECNCLGALTLADIHGHKQLYEFAKAFTCAHFTTLVEEEDFLKLSFDCIGDLLKDRRLNCTAEEVVYDAAIKWLDFDPEARKAYRTPVLECIKFPLIRENFLMDIVVRSSNPVGEDKGRDLLEDAVTFHTIPSRRNMLPAYQTTPRLSFPMFEASVLLGGRLSDGLSNDVTGYRSDTSEFFSMKQLPFKKRNEFAVCTIGDTIYVSGGLRSAEFWKYDTAFETWLRGSSLLHARRRHSMVAVDDVIYVLGGFDEENVLGSVEKWCSKSNKWENCGNLTYPVENMGYVAYGHKIYLFGGKNNDELVTNTVQCFDTMTSTCVQLTKGLPVNDMCLSAAVLNQQIYIVGLEGVFRFYPVAETWEILKDMKTPRDFISLAVLDEKLYSFGGRRRGAKDNLYSYAVECYDPKLNTWKEVGKMPCAMYCYGCVRVLLCGKSKAGETVS